MIGSSPIIPYVGKDENVPSFRSLPPERLSALVTFLWVGVGLAVSTAWALHLYRSISYRVYAEAGARWLAGEALYDASHIEGFQYLPHAAVLVSPLTALGYEGGGVLWRALGWAGLATGVATWARLLGPGPGPRARTYAWASLLSMSVAAGALQNGQANLHVAAFTLWVGIALAKRQWWQAAFRLSLGFALKPLMAVLILLSGALYRPVGPRLVLALAAVLAAPWLVADYDYVFAQHLGFIDKMRASLAPAPRYEDLRGLLATLGVPLSHLSSWALRLAAALGVLLVSWRTRSRLPAPQAALTVCGLASGYLVLFNPRSQATSYVIPGAVAALLTAQDLVSGRGRRALPLLACLGGWFVNRHWPGLAFTELWLKPLLAILFMGLLARRSLV